MPQDKDNTKEKEKKKDLSEEEKERNVIYSKRYGTFIGFLIGCGFTVLALILSEQLDFYLIWSILWLIISICGWIECIGNYIEYERFEKLKFYVEGSTGYYIGYFSFLISIIYLLLNKALSDKDSTFNIYLIIISMILHGYLTLKCMNWTKRHIDAYGRLKNYGPQYKLILILDVCLFILYCTFVGIQVYSELIGWCLWWVPLIVIIIVWIILLKFIKFQFDKEKPEKKSPEAVDKERKRKINEIKNVSNKISLERIQSILNMTNRAFNNKILEWANDLNFKIEGEYAVFIASTNSNNRTKNNQNK